MRKFLLENELGQRFDFQDYENSLSYALRGLGFKFDSVYSKVGEYYIANTRTLSQKSIGFNCLFQSPQKYRAFVDFITQADSLKIVYIDLDKREMFIDVDITNVQKDDNLRTEFIIANVDLTNTSLFYDRKESAYSIDVAGNENRWPMLWDVLFNDEVSGKLDVNVQGNSDAAYRLEIFGASLNPSITIIDRDNVTYEVAFNIDLLLGQKLIYSTVDNDLRLEVEHPNGDVVNVFNCIDFQKEGFRKLKVGYNQIIVNNISNAKMIVYDTYVSI